MPTQHPIVGTAVNFAANQVITATIPSGTSTSTAIDMTNPTLYGYTPVVIFLPAAWDSAKLSMQVSVDGATWTVFQLWDTGQWQTSATLQASDSVWMNGYPLKGMPYWRIISGVHNNTVNQTATRTLQILLATI